MTKSMIVRWTVFLASILTLPAAARARHVEMVIMPTGQAPIQVPDVPGGSVGAAMRRAWDTARQLEVAAEPMAVARSEAALVVAPASAIAIPAWLRSLPLRDTVPWPAAGCGDGPYRPSGLLTALAEGRRRQLYSMMREAACAHGLPVGLFDALVMQESGYDPAIVSPKRAFGLTQLMPGTALELGVDRFDVRENLRGGARYLRQQLDRFGRYHLALAAYNAGPDRVRGWRAPAIPETQHYIAAILSKWSRLLGTGRAEPSRSVALAVF